MNFDRKKKQQQPHLDNTLFININKSLLWYIPYIYISTPKKTQNLFKSNHFDQIAASPF